MSVGYTFFYKVASVWGWACIVNLHLHSRDKQLSHQPRVYTSHPHLTNYNINSELNWIQLTDHELFTVLKSTHCLLIVALSCSLITQSWFWVSCKGADDWRSIFFSSNKRLTRRFYRISEQLQHYYDVVSNWYDIVPTLQPVLGKQNIEAKEVYQGEAE